MQNDLQGHYDHTALAYPITYQTSMLARIASAVAAVLLGGFAYMMLHPGYANGALVVMSPLLVPAIAAVLSAAWVLWWAFTARIVLHADRFEQHKPFVDRMLSCSDIEGRRYSRKGNYPMLVPRQAAPFRWIPLPTAWTHVSGTGSSSFPTWTSAIRSRNWPGCATMTHSAQPKLSALLHTLNASAGSDN